MIRFSISTDMAPSYEMPSSAELVRFHSAIDNAVAANLIRIDSAEVATIERVPWGLDQRVVDVTIEVPNVSIVVWSNNDIQTLKRTGSSASHTQLSSAICHAASEALERICGVAGGDLSLRPTRSSVYDIHENRWVQLPYEPLAPPSSHNQNPVFSRSGESFHLRRGEAFRSAFCELLEREALGRLAAGTTKLFDITNYARDLSRDTAAALGYWTARGYEMRLSLIESPWKLCVVLASSQNRSGKFPLLFKGSGADFRPEHAINQAVSELGRNAFMGPAARYQTSASIEDFVNDSSQNWFERDNLALSMPVHGEHLAAKIRNSSLLTQEAWNQLSIRNNPQASIEALRVAGRKIWFVPLADDVFSIPGTACKFIAPDFAQEPRFATQR